MTFGTINIEKLLVTRRNTAESRTDDRGQLMGGEQQRERGGISTIETT